MPFQTGEHICKWLTNNSFNICGRTCNGEYCGKHSYQIRKNPNSGPKPCLKCGKGVRGPYQICGSCGGKEYKAILNYYRIRSPKYYTRSEPPTVEEFIARNVNISNAIKV